MYNLGLRFKRRKTFVNQNQGWETPSIKKKYKANENTSRHNPKRKAKANQSTPSSILIVSCL
jgi:hypothetical protein